MASVLSMQSNIGKCSLSFSPRVSRILLINIISLAVSEPAYYSASVDDKVTL
jgi:hypothetical protein